MDAASDFFRGRELAATAPADLCYDSRTLAEPGGAGGPVREVAPGGAAGGSAARAVRALVRG